MVSGICHFRGNCPYVKLKAFFIVEGAERCPTCYYFDSVHPQQKKVEPKPEPEPYNPFDYYRDNPDFLEIDCV
jgi:hypothetical protein